MSVATDARVRNVKRSLSHSSPRPPFHSFSQRFKPSFDPLDFEKDVQLVLRGRTRSQRSATCTRGGWCARWTPRTGRAGTRKAARPSIWRRGGKGRGARQREEWGRNDGEGLKSHRYRTRLGLVRGEELEHPSGRSAPAWRMANETAGPNDPTAGPSGGGEANRRARNAYVQETLSPFFLHNSNRAVLLSFFPSFVAVLLAQ